MSNHSMTSLYIAEGAMPHVTMSTGDGRGQKENTTVILAQAYVRYDSEGWVKFIAALILASCDF